MRARWRNRQRKRRAIVAVQISIARMTTAQTRMGNRIFGRSSTICGLLLLFFVNQQYFAVFCLPSLECYIEKDERMAWKQRKTGRRFAYTERKLRKVEESNRQKNIPITIVLHANNNTQETNKPLTDENNKITTRKYGKTHKNAPNEHNKCYFSDLTVEDLMV